MKLKVVVWVAADIIGILFSEVHIDVSSDGSWNKHEESSLDVFREKSLRNAGPETAFVFQAATESKEKSIRLWTWWPVVFRDWIYTVLGDNSVMIVDIDGPFIDAIGDSHAGSSICVSGY